MELIFNMVEKRSIYVELKQITSKEYDPREMGMIDALIEYIEKLVNRQVDEG